MIKVGVRDLFEPYMYEVVALALTPSGICQFGS